MKDNIKASAFIRQAIHDVFVRMYSQIDSVNAETGKPLLNSKTRKKLQTLLPFMRRIEEGKRISMDMQINVLHCLHVSENMTAKLEDINALSTACSVNPICAARSKDCNSICASCFAFLTFERYGDLEQAAIINFIILNAMVYSATAWKTVNIPASAAYGIFRIEAFGDVASAVQAANYIIIAKTHKYLGKLGLWSKNLGFWYTAFTAYGKPSNIVFNASSPVLNERIAIKPEFEWFIDHVFTVYNSEFALANNIDINCGDRKCKNCKRCYSKGNERNVNEILKQESKKYYKAIGKTFNGRK